MKKHITLIRNIAAAFLLLQAAGILHAADIPVKTGYDIRKDVKNAEGKTENTVCCSIALSVDKVQYNLTVPANTYSGYTAAYEDNNGNWMILQPKDKTTEWNEVTDATKKGKLAKLFTPVQNQNMEIATTDGTAAELTSAGYIAQSESPVLPAEISGQAYDGITIPTLSGGRFYLAEYGTGTTYLLTFKTSGSFMELEAEANSKEKLTKKKISDNMFAWLDAKDKKNCAYPALSEKLAEMLAESLIKKDVFDDLYKASGSEYIQLYLQHVYNNSRSIYADGLHEDEPLYNPKAYESIKDTEGERLAVEAKKYLTNGVEWGNGKKQNMIYKNSADKEYPSDDSTINGNALPYSTDGIDTPETFWYKMKTQADYYRKPTTARSKYYKKLYRPGDINGGTAAGCGTDSWGLLTGCIKGAGLAESISYAEKGEKKQPAMELAAYAEKIRNDAAGQYGDGSRKNSEAFADKQYDYQGLKETSMIVPSLSEVQQGDILYGKKKAGEDETDDGKELIGIITDTGTNSADPDAFMEKTKVVWMDRKAGCAVSTSWKTFSDAVGDLRCLRLLKTKKTSEKYEHAESWDVFDRVPASAELEIGSMKEESQVSSERWRWIPNTGEYLVLDKLSIQLKNRSGMKLKPVTGSLYSVTLAGAYDRNYDSTKAAEGNIYNNKAVSYDIVFLDEDDTVQCRGKLDKPEVKAAKRLYKFEKTEGTVPVMYADAVGNIYTTSGKRVRLGIRPESAESAYPGDDLIPAFQAVYSDTSGNIKYFNFQAKDGDYIAVYDKKLLWRANLYIDKTETVLGNIDWNNAHPWNVPPAAGVAQEGACPKSWSAAWGYNEWNRVHDGTSNTIVPITNLSMLPAGNGTQCIKLSTFTPVRTLGNKNNPPSANLISNTIAYSYPNHEYEPPISNKGFAGSMDSPFDFNKKMQKEITLMKDSYNKDGIAFAKPRSAWPSPDATIPANFSSWGQFKENVTGASNQNKIIPDATFTALNANSSNWAANSDLKKALKRWTRNSPPGDRWWRYIVTAPASWNDAATTPATNVFVPSLGLRYGKASTYFDEASITGVPVDDFLKKKYVIEAGTDCLGFVQRSASYSNTSSNTTISNVYAWIKLPKGWAETTFSNIWAVLNSYGTLCRHYPSDQNEATYAPVEADTIISKQKDEPIGDDFVSQLRLVVPGDIFVKESSLAKDNGIKRAHIAVVAYVPPDASGLSVSDLMNQIILVEAEYNNKIQSVIKVLSLGDYNESKIPLGFQIYQNFTTPKIGDKIDLNCESWAIRRLK
jgi:hypothetical protein